MTSRALLRKLEKDGWVLRNSKGSHWQFVHPERGGLVTLKHPSKHIPVGTLRNIYRQAQWDWRDRSS